MSGIYIPNADMPEKGQVVYIFPDGTWQKAFLGMREPFQGGLVHPIPDHGRLGDLDKLVEKIDGIWDCNDMVFKPDDHCCNVPEDCKGCKWAQTKDCIQRMVENAPTIIEAEEGE